MDPKQAFSTLQACKCFFHSSWASSAGQGLQYRWAIIQKIKVLSIFDAAAEEIGFPELTCPASPFSTNVAGIQTKVFPYLLESVFIEI